MPDPLPLEYASGADRARAWAKRLAVMLAFCPLLLLLCVYGGWLVAWAVLGHRPEPVFDDPAYAGWAVEASVLPAAILLVLAWPLFILHIAVVGAAFYPSLVAGAPRRRKLGVLAAAVLPWAAAFLLLNADPGNVLKWAGLTPP